MFGMPWGKTGHVSPTPTRKSRPGVNAMSTFLDSIAADLASEVRDTTSAFVKLGYVPTDRQREFHAATEYDVLYGGALGGGKTRALLMQGLEWCHTYPGVRIGAFRRSYPELKESLIAELATLGYAEALGAKWNGTEYELRFANTSILMFRYAENMTDATRRQGGQYQGLLFDERTLTPPDVVDFLYTRLRSGRADLPVLGVRSGSNPGGAGHGSVKARFVDATAYGTKIVVDARGRTVRFIPSKIEDNPHLNAEYYADLAHLSGDRMKAFRDGSWDVFAGQFFTEWDHTRHVVPPFELPASWQRSLGLDWGYAAPWAVEWGAVDEDGRVWIYDELYASNVGETDQARRILAAEEKHGVRITARYADDSMWTQRGEVKSVADIYAENGCFLTPARKGERVSGWQRVRSYLADGPACQHHRAMGWETCPMLHVLDGAAPDLVRTLPTLPYDTTPSKAEDLDTKAEDHAADALRYLLIQMGQSSLSGWSTPRAEPPDPFATGIDPMTPGPPGWGEQTWQEGIGWAG